MIKTLEKKNTIDYGLFISAFVLTMIGMLIVYSASMEMARSRFNNPDLFLGKQIIRIIVSLIACLFFIKVDYKMIIEKRVYLFWPLLAMLAFILLSSSVNEVNGAKRWISIFGFSFQPSDLARLVVVIFLAGHISKEPDIVKTPKTLINLLILPMSVVGLIVIQPDMSTAVIILLVTFFLLISSGLPTKYILTGIGSVFMLGILFIKMEPYRFLRLKAFLNSSGDGVGYQAKQSLISLGSGGLTGAGLGKSSQKLLFLPEPHTDFIFSILGEEFGFLGVLVVFVLFGYFLYRGLTIAKQAKDKSGYYLALGITISFALYFFIHLAVVSSLVPTTGIPLPFISYGGSSLLFNLIAVGILLNISSSKVIRK